MWRNYDQVCHVEAPDALCLVLTDSSLGVGDHLGVGDKNASSVIHEIQPCLHDKPGHSNKIMPASQKPHQITHDSQDRAEVVVSRVAPENINGQEGPKGARQQWNDSSGTACRCCARGNGREEGRTWRESDSETETDHKTVRNNQPRQRINVRHPFGT